MTRRHALALFTTAATAQETKILFGGDVMLARGVARAAQAHNDYSWPLREIAPVFREADIAFVNLEGPFAEKPRPNSTNMLFRVQREMVAGLATAGIDVVSTANNHARDAGSAGIDLTLEVLREQGILAAGTGKDFAEAHAGVVLTRNGVRFGFLAYTYDANNGNYTDVEPRIALADVAQMRVDVASLRQRAEVVIVSMHHGWEYYTTPNGHQKMFAKAAIDAGAAVVVGHHPHVVQPWERYSDGVIFYSLGNLVFDQAEPAGTKKGLLAEVTFRGAALSDVKTMPIEIAGGAPRLTA